jgi:hypothetical protein
MSKGKKNKTLRIIKTNLKRQKRFHGGSGLNEYKLLCDSYASNIEAKQDQYAKLEAEATHLYDAETTYAHEKYQVKMNNSVYYLRDFVSTLQSQYSAPTIPTVVSKELESIIAEAGELFDCASSMNTQYQTLKVHIHLLEPYFQYIESLKVSVNSINIKFQAKLQEYKIYLTQKAKDDLRQAKDALIITDAIQYKYNDLESALAVVNRPPPDGFVLNLNRPPVIGCPLGTVLVGDQCVYTNDLSGNENTIEMVPYQSSLQTTKDSDMIILFNNISAVSVGKPTIYKRKELQYLIPLLDSDVALYGAKYIVSESNGTPKKNILNQYTFIKSIECCWDQDSATIIPTGSSYYIDTDTFPQPVKVITSDVPIPLIHKDESFVKYVCALNDVEQIIHGIPYIETDASGSPIYDSNNNIIPFFPEPYNYKLLDSKFTQPSYNKVDTFTYNVISQYSASTNYIKTGKTIIDTSVLDPYVYNTIPDTFKNRYLQLELSRPYLPFILPNLSMEEGDYFLLNNTSKTHPIIFNISVDNVQQRIIVQPNQICNFVYSKRSIMLQYGYLYFSKNQSLKQSNNVAFIPSANVYAFVEAVPLYNKETYIMQQYQPLLDSENNVHTVPNFNELTYIARNVIRQCDLFFYNRRAENAILKQEQITCAMVVH